MVQKETIAAIATAMSPAGIGIVRISGPEAVDIADHFFVSPGNKTLKEAESHTIHYGHIVDHDQIIDEVLVMLMRGPKSFTAEDTVEIDCHGGILVVRKVLDLAVQFGARLAEPGEFTKRAFLNGRIDLAQAEAVADLISSKNVYALRSSVNQLNGLVSSQVKKIREEILFEMATLESALDDPEHISLCGFSEKLVDKSSVWIKECEKLSAGFHNGKMVQEGIKTVILGRPNVGKSSLMNVLMGEDRAIVTSVAGTTRDTLEEHLLLDEISLNLIDTAGIRDTEDVVEKIGVERAKNKAEEADLILYVVDASEDLDESDYEVIDFIQGRKAITVLNKMDLESKITPRELEFLTHTHVISFSTVTGEGLKELTCEIKKMFYEGNLSMNEELYMASERHYEAFQDTVRSLNLVKQGIEDQMPEDFYSIDLMDAYTSLGKILGEAVDDDLVNEIFSKFCMGK